MSTTEKAAAKVEATTIPEYRPTEQAVTKIEELLAKRKEYSDAITSIDLVVQQLRYGISMKVDGKTQCNGFGSGYDITDYACRELCNKSLQAACKKIVEVKREKKIQVVDPTNPDAKYLGFDVPRGF